MIISILSAGVGRVAPILLILTGIYFSARLNMVKLVAGALGRKKGRRKTGKVSPFAAVMMALAGTLGVGNIVGVAGAVSAGGYGAVFWMWASSLCAMALKYAETVLAVSHRRSDGRGGFFGGAVYYIRDIFASLGHDRAGSFTAFVFSLLFLFDGFTTGCAVQINAAAKAAESIIGIPAIAVGIAAAVIAFIPAAKGTENVAGLTTFLVPVLSGIYVILSIVVLVIRADRIPYAFSAIFSGAFSTGSAAGGILGFLTSRALRFGTIRGLLSNEAGCGSSPTAHASADTDDPVRQGFLGIFEVFADTIVLCTMTALVIIVNSDVPGVAGETGIMLALRSYSVTLGKWSEYILAASVAVFGLATVVCRAHYGCECIRYFCRGNEKNGFRFIFLALFSAVTVIGSVASADAVLSAADLSIGSMTILNLVVLLLGRKEVFALTKGYFDKEKS